MNAWKQAAKVYRDFYNNTMRIAQQWKAKHKETQATADRLQAEKDALMEALDIADARIAELETTLDDARLMLEQRDKRAVGRENRIAELEALIDEVVALDPLFPDELMDRLKGVE